MPDALVTDHAWDLDGSLIVRDPPATAEKVGRGNRKLMSGNGLFGRHPEHTFRLCALCTDAAERWHAGRPEDHRPKKPSS